MKTLFISDNLEQISMLQNIFHGSFKTIEFESSPSEKFLDFLNFNGPYSFIFLDTTIKEIRPMSIANSIIELIGEIPIIFTGQKSFLNSQIDDDFYLKNDFCQIYELPFHHKRLIDILEGPITFAENREIDNNAIINIRPEEYLPLRLKNLYLFKKIQYDAYIEITQKKYLKVISKNVSYRESEILSLQKRNIKYVYLKKDDQLKLLSESLGKIEANLQLTKDAQKLIKMQVLAITVLQQYITDIGATTPVVKITNLLIDSVRINIRKLGPLKETSLLPIFSNMSTPERSLLIMYTFEAIIKGMGWDSELTRKKLGLTALLHDIYLINDSLIKIESADTNDLDMFTDEEIKSFNNHQAMAANIAKYFSGHSDTEFIIYQHHELPNGEGLPEGLNSSRITTVSAIFIIAHKFAVTLAVHGNKIESIKHFLKENKIRLNIGNFKQPLDAIFSQLIEY